MPRFSCPAICSEIRQARPAMANHQQYSSISKAILIGHSFDLNRISFSEGKCGLRAVNWSLPHWSLPAQLHPAGQGCIDLVCLGNCDRKSFSTEEQASAEPQPCDS